MKEIRKFSKKLTKNNLMQADIFTEFEKQGFQEKVKKCFDYRIKKLQKKQMRETNEWNKVKD
jgi:hypothetical protein